MSLHCKPKSLSRVFIYLLVIILVYIPACTVFAQQPAGDDVDAQAERFKKGIEERREKFEEKEIKPLDIEIEEEAKPAAPEGPSFILKDIKITGMTVFKPEDFLPIYEPYLNKEITFKGLQVIAEKIKARYKAGGYLTTVVFIPEQDITDGKVKIRAVEGKMGNLILFILL